MKFQVTTDVSHLFADALAAYIRSRADVAQSHGESASWHLLWTTFRDADSTTVEVPDETASWMYRVWGVRAVWRDEATRQRVKDVLRPQWKAQMLGQPAMTLAFEEFPEPRRWTSDGGRLHWVAYGKVVVTCSEHGEVFKALSTSLTEKEHPWHNSQARLWEDNHLRQEHGISRDR